MLSSLPRWFWGRLVGGSGKEKIGKFTKPLRSPAEQRKSGTVLPSGLPLEVRPERRGETVTPIAT